MRSLQNSGSVESALRHLRELLARPPALFDPYATVAALEALVDAARQHSTENAGGIPEGMAEVPAISY